MVHNAQFITLSGIDGSGKSTLANTLQNYFQTKYYLKCRCVWCKFGEIPFHKTGRSNDDGNQNTYLENSGNLFAKVGGLNNLYFSILMFFHLLKIYIQVVAPIKQGVIIICDRYIYDTLVDLEQEHNINKTFFRKLLKLKWIPEPKWKYLLDLTENQAQSRKHHSSEGYLSERRLLYIDIAEEYDLRIIDAGKPPDEVFRLVTDDIRIDGNLQG